MKKIVLRIDDIGASGKIYNQRGRKYWPILGKQIPLSFFADWLFFKRIKPFALWAKYPELNVKQWEQIFSLIKSLDAKLTVGITACWAETETSLIPFDKKFPEEASILKEGLEERIIEIANHGLTHCVLINNLFLPQPFSSNRKYHREFWDWLSPEIHREHIFKSQEILTNYFKNDIKTFIPPGGIWADVTEKYAFECGIKYLSAVEKRCPTGKESNGLIYVGNNNMIDFHDREIALYGTKWLKNETDKYSANFCSVEEYFNK